MKNKTSNPGQPAHDAICSPSAPEELQYLRLMPDYAAFLRGTRPVACLRRKAVFGVCVLSCCLALTGCDSTPNRPAPAAATRPAEPSIPQEFQDVAKSILGREAQVLAYGDLAKTGRQQVLAANVVPKTPQNNIPGMVVTRAIVVEKNEDKWTEILRADEHLKNVNGFLALSPIDPISGWRIQWEESADKGLQLYFTPVKGNSDPHVLPVGVRWNPETKRYQSMDRSYEHFLLESPSLGEARSKLR